MSANLERRSEDGEHLFKNPDVVLTILLITGPLRLVLALKDVVGRAVSRLSQIVYADHRSQATHIDEQRQQ